jgi:hypothetical protein
MTGKVWGVLLRGQTYRFLTAMARISNRKTWSPLAMLAVKSIRSFLLLENNHRKSPRNLKSSTMRTNHTLADKWNPKAIQLKLKSRNTLVGLYHDEFKLKFL